MNYNNNLCAPPKALIHSSQSPSPPAVLQGGGRGDMWMRVARKVNLLHEANGILDS